MDSLDTPFKRLKWAREKHDRRWPKASEAIKSHGWTASTYYGHENGRRNYTVDEARDYGRTYKVKWEWLIDGKGSPTLAMARVIGKVHDSAQVLLNDDKNLVTTETELPPGCGPKTVAVEAKGEMPMQGMFDDGWLFFFDDVKEPPNKNQEGKLCVVQLDNGKVLIRTLRPARRKNRYDLEFPPLRPLLDQRIVWAAAITWIKPG